MTSLATDNFNRADGGLGANWTTITGTSAPRIASNAAASASNNTDSGAFNNTQTWPNDHYSSVRISTVASQNDGGPIARAQAGSYGFYCVVNTGSAYTLYAVSAGNWVQIGTKATSDWATNDIVTVLPSGTTIKVLVNNIVVITATDSAWSSGSPGFFQYDGTLRFDDWEGGNLTNFNYFTPKVLTSIASAADAQTYTTSSISPAGNSLLLMAVQPANTANPPPGEPTIGGTLSATWTKVDTATFNTIASPKARLSLYYTQLGASPGSGTVSVDFGATAGGCNLVIEQLTGHNANNPVTANKGQSTVDSSTSTGVTLSALASTLNLVYQCASRDGAARLNPATGFQEFYDASQATPAYNLETAWATNKTTATAGPISGSAAIAVIAVEINEATVGLIDDGPLMHGRSTIMCPIGV